MSSAPRSSGIIRHRRDPVPWPEDRDFRILSIDGGGMRGLYPASVLTGLEERYLNGQSVADYFDLIVGTSTGGIIALGLGAGLRASDMRDLYVQRGSEIFPPRRGLPKLFHAVGRVVMHGYDGDALESVLREYLGDTLLGDSKVRLCVPSFEGEHSEVFVFKTPHHRDFKLDWRESMVKVALATSAAPSYFRPLDDGGYRFVDGGIWANNPVMIGLVEALTSFSTPRDRIRILSLGCGSDQKPVGKLKSTLGGLAFWHDVMFAAMRLQSLSALGQAYLMIGFDAVTRVDAPDEVGRLGLDDWRGSVTLIPNCARVTLDKDGDSIASVFLREAATPYKPFYPA